MSLTERIDAYQQRHAWVGFPLDVTNTSSSAHIQVYLPDGNNC